LAIVLSVLLRFTASAYSFGFFKIVLSNNVVSSTHRGIGTNNVAASTSRHERDSNIQSYNVVHMKAEMYVKYLAT